MASADEFRRLALAFPGAEERSHLGHPDFRVGGKVFATLGYPDAAHGVAVLAPEQQELALAAEPEAFSFVVYPGSRYLGQLTETTRNAHRTMSPGTEPPPIAIYDTDAPVDTTQRRAGFVCELTAVLPAARRGVEK